MAIDIADIRTPKRGFSPLSGLLSGQFLPALAARLGIARARRKAGPLRFFKTVIAVRHRDAMEVLARDLDFTIASINAEKIQAVNGGPFVLGMDRSPRQLDERAALYGGLAGLDYAGIEAAARADCAARIAAANGQLDAIADFARPVATATASRLFGIAPDDMALFAEVVRAVFAHTFLNLGNDKTIERRAVIAGGQMQEWFATEIARRRKAVEPGNDLMGQLIRGGALDDEGVRRNLGGMLVGSIDTTASAIAKIISVAWQDDALRQSIVSRWTAGKDIYGLCLEALRRWPHNPILLRAVAGQTELAGVTIKPGDRVVVWTQAAMLDAEAFPDPARMIPDRPQDTYLHFGAGLHPCAGRWINALQIPAIVGSLLAAGAQRAGALGWAGPFPDRLPVRLTGASGS